ncbi:MAG TPA: hypothetical protein VK111_14350, partial [Virgibacillus sp.]|nr:hypothetical protein [Virgibacillus sp.]
PIENTFLGDVCEEEESVLDKIETYLQTNFAEREDLKDEKYLVFDHIDQKNCKRIYEAIEELNDVKG